MSLAIVKTHFATVFHRSVGSQQRQHRDIALVIEGFKVHRSETVWYDGKLVVFDPPRPCAGRPWRRRHSGLGIAREAVRGLAAFQISERCVYDPPTSSPLHYFFFSSA
jgi:hypothetical protein